MVHARPPAFVTEDMLECGDEVAREQRTHVRCYSRHEIEAGWFGDVRQVDPDQVARSLFGKLRDNTTRRIAVRVEEAQTSPCLHVLRDAVLQERCFACAGLTDDIDVAGARDFVERDFLLVSVCSDDHGRSSPEGREDRARKSRYCVLAAPLRACRASSGALQFPRVRGALLAAGLARTFGELSGKEPACWYCTSRCPAFPFVLGGRACATSSQRTWSVTDIRGACRDALTVTKYENLYGGEC